MSKLREQIKQISKKGLNKDSVYMLVNDDTGKYYIGSTNSPVTRLNQHINKLNKGIHENKKLQDAFKENDNFQVIVTPMDDRVDAHLFESCLINEHTGDPNFLNIAPAIDVSALDRDISLTSRQIMSENAKLHWQDEEYKSRMTAAAKARWQDPEYRSKMLDVITRTANDPENKQKVSKLNIERWNEPGRREARSEKSIALWKDEEYRNKTLPALKEGRDKPEVKARMTENMKNRWTDDNYRSKMTNMSRELFNNPEHKARHLAAMNTVEIKERMSLQTKKQFEDPAAREVSRQAAKKQWETPGYRESKIRKVIANGIEYPSLTEAAEANEVSPSTVCYRIKNEKLPEWKYV